MPLSRKSTGGDADATTSLQLRPDPAEGSGVALPSSLPEAAAPASAAPASTEAGARELVHRTNNFLTVCSMHGEWALSTDDPAEMREALRRILESAGDLARFTRAARPA